MDYNNSLDNQGQFSVETRPPPAPLSSSSLRGPPPSADSRSHSARSRSQLASTPSQPTHQASLVSVQLARLSRVPPACKAVEGYYNEYKLSETKRTCYR